MYKIFYYHCNKCLYPSLWNIALKDIKKHSPHKMTWVEKVSKQSTILCSSHYTAPWILSAVWSGTQGVRQQTPHHQISMPHLLATSAVPTSSWMILVTVSGDCFSLLAIANFIHAYVVNLFKKKSSSIFSFLTIF